MSYFVECIILDILFYLHAKITAFWDVKPCSLVELVVFYNKLLLKLKKNGRSNVPIA